MPEPVRALYLIVKAKMEAVEAGISTVEREFLYDIVPVSYTHLDCHWVLPQVYPGQPAL